MDNFTGRISFRRKPWQIIFFTITAAVALCNILLTSKGGFQEALCMVSFAVLLHWSFFDDAES
jgi:hypothetical protein